MEFDTIVGFQRRQKWPIERTRFMMHPPGVVYGPALNTSA